MVDRLAPAPVAVPSTPRGEVEEAPVAKPAADTKPLDLNYHPAGWSAAAAARRDEAPVEKPNTTVSLTGALVAGVVGGLAMDRISSRQAGQPAQQSLSNMKDNLRHWDADWSGYGLGTKTGAAHNALHYGVGAAAYLTGRARGETVLNSSLMAGAIGLGIELGQSAKFGHRPDASDMVRTWVGGTIVGGATELALGAAIKGSERFGGEGNAVQRVLRGITSVGIGRDSKGGLAVSATASYTF